MVGGFDKYLDDLSNRFSGVKARFEKVVTGKLRLVRGCGI